MIGLEHESGALIKGEVSFALGAQDDGPSVTRQESLAFQEGRGNEPAAYALPLETRRNSESVYMIVARAFDQRAIAFSELAARGGGAQKRPQAKRWRALPPWHAHPRS